jgi:hypothetical protein
MEIIDVYVDGSFDKKGAIAKWGFIAVRNSQAFFNDSGIVNIFELLLNSDDASVDA